MDCGDGRGAAYKWAKWAKYMYGLWRGGGWMRRGAERKGGDGWVRDAGIEVERRKRGLLDSCRCDAMRCDAIYGVMRYGAMARLGFGSPSRQQQTQRGKSTASFLASSQVSKRAAVGAVGFYCKDGRKIQRSGGWFKTPAGMLTI